MSVRSLLGECLWPRDARTTGEIDAEVREELQSHVERMAEDQVRAGVPAEEARRCAAAQFGDVERYAAECRRIDLGERLIVRRALCGACVALLVACIYLGWSLRQNERHLRQLRAELAESSQPAPPLRAEWATRLSLLRDHMHTAFAVGPELTLLAPDEGVAIVRDAWPRIDDVDVKTGLLKAFVFSKSLPSVHPRVLDVLHLGMTDVNPAVRTYAAVYLEEFAHENFDGHPDRYLAWRRQHGDAAPEELRHSDND